MPPSAPLDPARVIAEALDERAAKAEPSRTKKKAKASRKPKAPKCRRPRKESTKTIMNRLYRLWSDIVKHLFDHRCAICGIENSPEHPLNAHHIMPRQNFSGLRFHPKNGVALCPKCHKLGKYSAHKGGIWFAEWLRTYDREAYEFCLSHHADELDCKDRMALYDLEYSLAYSSEGIDCGFILGIFKVEAVRRDGELVSSSVQAYNAKAAETIFWENRSESEPPLKGIVSCKPCKVNLP